MPPSLMPLLFHFMRGFALASVIGGISYWLVYYLRRAPTDCSTTMALCFVSVLLSIVLVASLFAREFKIAAAFTLGVGVLGLICAGGAFSETAIKLVRSSLWGHMVALFCSVLIAAGMARGLGMSTPLFDQVNDEWGVAGVWAGLIITPPAIPTFIWLWRTSKARPGIDRHLNSFDEIDPPR